MKFNDRFEVDVNDNAGQGWSATVSKYDQEGDLQIVWDSEKVGELDFTCVSIDVDPDLVHILVKAWWASETPIRVVWDDDDPADYRESVEELANALDMHVEFDSGAGVEPESDGADTLVLALGRLAEAAKYCSGPIPVFDEPDDGLNVEKEQAPWEGPNVVVDSWTTGEDPNPSDCWEVFMFLRVWPDGRAELIARERTGSSSSEAADVPLRPEWVAEFIRRQ